MLAMSELALFVLIGGSGYKDMKERRIPNSITITAILIGWMLGIATGGWSGFLDSFVGSLVGLGIFFLPFALGGMGAGDVKMLAAIGSLMGWRFSINAALYGSLVGGIMVLIYLLKQRQLKSTLQSIAFMFITFLTKLFMKYRFSDALIQLQHRMAKEITDYKPIYIPYGVAIALGSLIVWALENKLLLL